MSNRIKILNATADDFAMEVVSTVPANGSVGDHANGRLVKHGAHMYVWCDHQGIWAKFANVSDFTSLETRLSQQEDANTADVSSLEAIDVSLEVRISEEESAMLSSIASEQSRATSEESSIETRISSMISSRVQDVSSEASLQESLVIDVGSQVSTMISDRISAVDSLEARATSAETSLENRLSTEEFANWSATLYDGTVPVSDAEYARGAMDSTIVSDITSATSDRGTGDSSLENAISIEEARISAILHASTADKDSFAEIVNHINAVDLAHDAQTSTEIASLAADVDSMELSLETVDNLFETDLSNEEDAASAADTSLSSRLATEESEMTTSDASLTTRLASEESSRLAADNSLGGRMGVNEVSRANADISIGTRLSNEEDEMAVKDLSLETLLSGDASDRVSEDSSLQTRVIEEESAMLSAVASEESDRIAQDSSIELLVSAEEITGPAADTSLESRSQANENVRSLADSSLSTRIASEEQTFGTEKGSLTTNLSSELVDRTAGDSSVETRFSNEISVEKSKINEILDSADADKNTFVELVSFITEFDVDTDDTLASYQLVIDSRITAEESNMAAGDLSIETGLAAKIVERQSVVSSLETKHLGEISSLTSTVDSVELREQNRHLRIDFSNKTSFTVLQSDLPTGFTPGNGLIQVFQEVSSNTYRRLVSPMSYDPTTGEMTFDLGVSAKSGFAVFYSFAGDESSVSTSGTPAPPPPGGSNSTSTPEFTITGATMSMGANQGDASSLTISVSGMTASNHDAFLRYTADTFYIYIYGQTTFSFYNVLQNTNGVSFSWNTDYSEMTIGWTNYYAPSTIAWSGSSPSTAHYAQLSFGTSTDAAFFEMLMYFDPSTGSLLPQIGSLGYHIDNGDTVYLSPPYMSGTGTVGYTATVSNGSYYYRRNRSRSLTGPQITVPLSNLTYGTNVNSFRNFGNPPSSGGSSVGSTAWQKKSIFGSANGSPSSGYWAVQLTNGGVDYYAVNNIGSTHHLYSDITASRTQSNTIENMGVMVNDSTDELEISWFRSAYSGAPTPDSNTTVAIYFAAPGGTAGAFPIGDTYRTGSSINDNWSANASYATDIKIVIDMTDQSYDIYRNSNVGGSPTWVAVDRAYLSNQEVN